MKLFSRELSKALQEAGCVSESGFVYITPDDGSTPYVLSEEIALSPLSAFHPWDLCGGSERERENAKKWWGEYLICRECGCLPDLHEEDCSKPKLLITVSVYHRHAIIDLPEDEQEAYVWKTMKRPNSVFIEGPPVEGKNVKFTKGEPNES